MSLLERAWYKRAGWLILLWPLAVVFRLLAAIRRSVLTGKAQLYQVPVVVVGNLSVGGTGKTPMVMALCKHLKERGYRPGVVSRGYGSEAPHYPFAVDIDSEVSESGDEALLIAQTTCCPVVIGADRNCCVEYLLEHNDCNVVISDDGLQHYAMHRDIEIVMVDGKRFLSNRLCLPAGPLREPPSRLNKADFIVVNSPRSKLKYKAMRQQDLLGLPSFDLKLKPQCFINLSTAEKRPFAGAPFNLGSKLQAVTGIGNPQRFYRLLKKLPYTVSPTNFPDHHKFSEQDFEDDRLSSHQPIVMTEKDAVKCKDFARSNFWYLQVAVKLPEQFYESFDRKLEEIIHNG